MPHTATMLTSWARAIRDALAAAGVDAVPLFRAAGLEVVPAPTQFKSAARSPLGALDLLPQSNALRNSYFALHEWLGIAWLALTVEGTTAQ